jgi:diguanylate cyclase (GGDEF)-like protein/PAS domain S-box-containing protein
MLQEPIMTGISSDKLLDSLFDGLYYVDHNRRISYWNKAAERITGYTSEEVTGSFCADNILRHIAYDGKELCNCDCPLAATLLDGKVREVGVMVHHKHGYRLPVLVRTAPVRDDFGAIIGAVEIFTDNSNAMQILEAFEKLKQDILVDPLTGIGNRRYGEISLDSITYEWHTHGIPFGVLFLDIDNFKYVNDNFGHNTGDEVLTMVAKSMVNVVRKFDMVSRWGGEEFIAILPGANLETLDLVAERIRVTVEQSFLMRGDFKLNVTVSIGGTMAEVGNAAADTVARADDLMYLSKKNGRNLVSIG